jgi:GxxExxY protein
MSKKHVNLLYKELSYQIRGAAIEVKKNYGPGHKEVLYQRAFAEELNLRKMNYEREKPIKIYSPKTKKVIGFYQPDFIIENKIIIELKALEQMPQKIIDQLYSYLRNSPYELGFLVNFGASGVDIKRVIYTNDRKKHLNKQIEARIRNK